MGMRIVTGFFVAVVVLGSGARASAPTDTACAVTVPNGIVAGETARNEESYGNALLSVGPFGLWPDGTVIFKPGGAGLVMSDGALSMKFGWTRAVPGSLKITGRRLDADAGPLRSNVPCCYEATGFQATALVFPTPGCWQVKAQIGDRRDSTLTFVTRVVKIGDGPAGRGGVR